MISGVQRQDGVPSACPEGLRGSGIAKDIIRPEG